MNEVVVNKRKNFDKQEIGVAIYTAVICFLTYASVYAFRKPFTVGTFSGESKIFGLVYKDALVICQVLGYMFSKFYGIKFISELKNIGRGKAVLVLLGISWIALLLFAVIPAPWNIVFLFINGFPLGMIWGIIFSFAEGRRTTDFIGATLAVSFIFSSGFVKFIAKWLMIYAEVSEKWLPFVTGLLFMIPVILLIRLLEKIPPPSQIDKENRVERQAMNAESRRTLFKKYSLGIVLLIIVYVFLTIFRDIRDNFAADMWNELGFGNQPGVFTQTEIPVTISVLILISAMMLIKNNRQAFIITHYLIIAGFLLSGISSLMFSLGWLSPFSWMICVGLGLYIGYIPFNCILFDRMIAAFGTAANVGFLMYLADSFGYMGSVGVIITKTIFSIKLQWTTLYSVGVIYMSIAGIILTILAIIYFTRKFKTNISYHA
jgi:MFS family permease